MLYDPVKNNSCQDLSCNIKKGDALKVITHNSISFTFPMSNSRDSSMLDSKPRWNKKKRNWLCSQAGFRYGHWQNSIPWLENQNQ